MRIKLSGFRGFKDSNDWLNITDITLLTGKNGSGKSKFLNYLRLFISYLDKVHSFSDYFKVDLDCNLDHLGGVDNMFYKNQKATVSITSYFEYFQSEMVITYVIIAFDHSKAGIVEINIREIDTDTKLISYRSSGLSGEYYSNLNILEILARYNTNVENYNAVLENRKTVSYQRKKSKKQFSGTFRDHLFQSLRNEEAFPYNIREYYSENSFEFSRVIHDEIGPHAWQGERYGFEEDEIGLYSFVKIHPLSINAFLLDYDQIEGVLMDHYPELENDSVLKNKIIADLRDDFKRVLDSLVFYSSSESFKIRHHELFNKYNKYSEDFDAELVLLDLLKVRKEILKSLTSKFRYICLKGIEEVRLFFSGGIIHSSLKTKPKRHYNLFESTDTVSNFIYDYSKLSKIEKNDIGHIISEAVQLVGLCDYVKIQNKDNAGFIYLVSENIEIPLIDEGSGRSRLASIILSVIMQLFKREEKQETEDREIQKYLFDSIPSQYKLIILEEPESNLHPNLQSKIADFLVFISSHFKVKFLIETHSEYFIRKLQFLVGTRSRNMIAADVNINYFELIRNGKSYKINLKPIMIDSNGHLETEFGSGFFDEADNLAISLFNLNKGQNN